MMNYSEIFQQLDLELGEHKPEQHTFPFMRTPLSNVEHIQYMEDCRKAFSAVAVIALASTIPSVFAFAMLW